MTTEIETLKLRIVELEKNHLAFESLFLQLVNRELVLRAAVSSLIFQAPPRSLTDDFHMFLDQIAEILPPEWQRPEQWKEIISAIEHDHKPVPKP